MDHKEMSDPLCVRQRLPVMWDITVHPWQSYRKPIIELQTYKREGNYKPIKEKETYKRTTKCWAVKFLKTNGIYYLQDNATSNATGSYTQECLTIGWWYYLNTVLLNMPQETTKHNQN